MTLPHLKSALALALSLTALTAANMIRAETDKTFQVSATVMSGCAVLGSGSTSGDAGHLGTLDFGIASALSTDTLTASLNQWDVALQCSPNTAVSVQIDGGKQPSGGRRQLALNGGNQRVSYDLKRQTTMAPIGIDQIFSETVTGELVFRIHAEAPLSGDLPPGTYTDALRVTIGW
ncbi:hypothetical protein SDC9_88446 [bioreactor metagenome]|uniref:Spore coat protein U/FanG domain-containing protein n=1 Tax=bioreactor metagenome TaxID=1076179 RepID=A0A644ZM38_9ZZZZ